MDDLRVRTEAAALEEAIREHDRPNHGVVDEYEQVEAGTGRDPERRHRPDERRRGEAEDAIVRADQGTGAKEADPGDHAAEERQWIVAFQVDREDRQRRRARGHEDERPEPDGLAADLPLQADPEGKGEDEQESEDALSRVDRHPRNRS